MVDNSINLIEIVNKFLIVSVFNILHKTKMIIDKMEDVMKDIKKLFGMRMKELRRNRELSQEKLAEKTDVSSKYLSRIEMGQHFPSMEVLLKLTGALNIEIKDLFEFSHKASSQKELKETLNSLLKEADDERLRLVVKIVKAIVR